MPWKTHFLTLMLDHDLKAKRDDRGATAEEYALPVTLIAAVIPTLMGFVGQDVLTAFSVIGGGFP